MMNCTCKDCTDRHFNCHANCEAYQAFRREREAIIKARWDEKNKDFLEVKRHRDIKDLMIKKKQRGR